MLEILGKLVFYFSFTEKDTIWEEVAAVASLYGVSAISGGGFPSCACTENMVKAISRSKACHRTAFEGGRSPAKRLNSGSAPAQSPS